MSSWSKAMGTVLGSFSVAALATLLDETLNVQKQALPDADSSRELSLSAQTITTSRTIVFRIAGIDFEQALELMASPTHANDRGQIFSSKSPSSQFLVECRIAFDSSHFHNLSKVQPQ